YRNVKPRMAQAVATTWNSAKFCSEPAADGVVIVVRQFRAECFIENFNFRDAHRPPAVAASLEDGFFCILVVFVLDFANDLFENVLHGHQAGRATVFVDDNRQMVSTAAKIPEQYVQALCFRNEYGGPHQRTQIKLRIADGQEKVFGEQDADDIIAVAFIDWEAGMSRFDNLRQQFGKKDRNVEHGHL